MPNPTPILAPHLFIHAAGAYRDAAVRYENMAIRACDNGEDCAKAGSRKEAAACYRRAAMYAREASDHRIAAAGVEGGTTSDTRIALLLCSDAQDYDLLAEFYETPEA